jgi:hypothetical protein
VYGYDPDGDTMTAPMLSTPAFPRRNQFRARPIGVTNGTLTLNPDGTFTYIPNTHYAGPDSFTYTWSDGLTTGSTATVVIDVYNSAPYACDASFSVLHDRELTGSVYGYDPDGDAITAQLVSGPTNGTLTLNPDGTFTYTPNTHYVGPDSFTYAWSDGLTTGSTATISIDVWNRAPTTFPLEVTVYEGEEFFLVVPDLALDPDGDRLNFELPGSDWNGTVVFEGDVLKYRAPTDWSGQEVIRLRFHDGVDVSEASVTIQVLRIPPGAVNDLYIIDIRNVQSEGRVFQVPASRGVLRNDFAAGGRTLTAQLVQSPGFTRGSDFTLSEDGSFAYALAENFTGEDSFQYLAWDGYAATQVANVRLLITDGVQAVDNVFELTEANRDQNGWYLMSPEQGLLANDYIPPDAKVVGIELLVSRNAEWFELLEQVDTEGNITAAGMRIYAYDLLEVADIEVRYRVTYQIPDGRSVRTGTSEANVFLWQVPNQQASEWVREGGEWVKKAAEVALTYFTEGLGEAMSSATKILVQEIYEKAYLKPYEERIMAGLGQIAVLALWDYLNEQSLGEAGQNPYGFMYAFSSDKASDQEPINKVRLAARAIWKMFKDEDIANIEADLRQKVAQALQGKRWDLKLRKPYYEVLLHRTTDSGLPIMAGRGLQLMVRPVLVADLTVNGRTLRVVQYGPWAGKYFPNALGIRDIGTGGIHQNDTSKELELWHQVTRRLRNLAGQ